MKTFLITALLGIAAGCIDVLPMIKMKLGRHAIFSALAFYIILPFIILNTDLFGLIWWLKGGVLGLLLALPVMILAAKEDKKAVPPMVVMSALLGTLMGVAGHYLI